ncbi:hypothetical protein KDL44_04400 [bacterium]|nr:hypothetical protein [bacterium]
MSARIYLLALSMLLATLVSCGKSAVPVSGPQPGFPTQNLLPGLTELDSMHGTSSLNRTVILGKDTYVRSSGCTVRPGGELLMESQAGTVCWAIWQLPDEPEYLDSVFFDIIDALGEGGWLAVANYSSGRWDFSGPFSDQTTIDFPSEWPPSPGGFHYFAALVHEGASIEMAQLLCYFDDGWQIVTVSAEHAAGVNSAVADIAGHPAIAYRRDEDEALRYAWSSTETGAAAADWTDLAIPALFTAGRFCSLADINGRPAISFRGENDNFGYELHYAISNNSSGSASGNWSVIVLDPTPDVGYHTSLAMINDRPAIAYSTQAGQDLYYTRSASLHGEAVEDWSTPVAIDHDGSGDLGADCSLALVDGRPAVSYYANGNLRYCWSSTAAGEAEDDWNIRIIDNDTPSNVGFHSSLAVIGGKPAISYYDQLHADLKFAWSSTAGGQSAADWQLMEVPGPAIAGQYSRLVELDGQPAVCYYTVGSLRDLLFDQALPAAIPEAWAWQPYVTVDGNDPEMPADVGRSCSMAIVNGRPVISYYDATTESLKYAVRVLP